MYRYFIKLAYVGTAYQGWQQQRNVDNTVQQVLNAALSRLLSEKIETLGCGRTDAGVPAIVRVDQSESRGRANHCRNPPLRIGVSTNR